jgi:hypothetical protein
MVKFEAVRRLGAPDRLDLPLKKGEYWDKNSALIPNREFFAKLALYRLSCSTKKKKNLSRKKAGQNRKHWNMMYFKNHKSRRKLRRAKFWKMFRHSLEKLPGRPYQF